jgi:hypothetical protein
MQHSIELQQWFALLIIISLGVVLIRAFRRKSYPAFINVPKSKCQQDYKAIMGSIEDSTTDKQLDILEGTTYTFFKLHCKVKDDNREVIRFYTELHAAIDKKRAEINAVTEVW